MPAILVESQQFPILSFHGQARWRDFNYFAPFTVNAAFGHGDFLANYQRPGIHRFPHQS
ncbi:MAG TPA: hypothetical protein VJQ54_11115 [Candidatus Sulfotelmatobacter sp.]|nr:hypothetical protein [Candidatus Sulfotelmatobacter sp.]